MLHITGTRCIFNMAEGWSSSVLCRYYLSGCCRDGSSCRFSHDRQTSSPNMVCRYYLKGRCTYGERCRYDHIRPSQITADRTALTQNDSSDTSNSNNSNNVTPNKELIPSTSTSPNSETKKSPSNIQNQTDSEKIVLKKNIAPILCAEAPEFVPGMEASNNVKSYAEVTVDPELNDSTDKLQVNPLSERDMLCPYAIMGECRYGTQCAYIHGDICELCSQACLHPTDADQRRQHQADCLKAHERDMELSFAVARSKDKICTICMDVILEKWPQHERRFGILPNCNHIFCLACIRTWRGTKQLENKTVRSCPQCRTPSDFVTPSKWWIDSKEEKDRLINAYKKALSMKPCKYFKQGGGECPFAGNCFYLHAYPDGQKATLPPPRPRRRRNADGDIELMQQIFLWDFMDERESRWLLQFDLDDMLDFFSDSEDSSDDNYSDFDI